MPTRFHWKFLDNDISRVYHGCELFTGIEAIIFSRLEPCRGIAARSISDIPQGRGFPRITPPHYKILIFNQLHADSFVYTIYLCSWPTKTNSIECLGEPITYHPWSRRGKSSLSQGRSSDSFPPLRLPSLKPVAKSARSCPIRAETHSNGYCRRFSLHSLFVSGHRIIPGKPCDAKLENYFIKILK